MRVLEDRELVASAVFEYGGFAIQNDKLMDQMVQRGTQLVDRFTGQEHPRGSIGIGDILVPDGNKSADGPAGSIDVCFDLHGVGLRFTKEMELLLKIVDVGFGSA